MHQFIDDFRSRLIGKGQTFYRRWLRGTRIGRLIKDKVIALGYISPGEIYASSIKLSSQAFNTNEGIEESVVDTDSGVPGFHLSEPLNFIISDTLALRPHINVLLPSLKIRHMSGGPNTAILLAAYLAETGESVRLISTDISIKDEESAIYPHMDGLFQRPIDRKRITVVDGKDCSKPVMIGVNDIFLATAWWTAQIAKYAIRKTRFQQFIYLIQDFEPILHEASTFQARALETYALPHIPVINTRLLLDHLIQEGCGCYSQPDFVNNALCFEPAIDRNQYFPDSYKDQGSDNPKHRVLLFYARPTIAKRNLFEIGLIALRQAVAAGFIEKENWDVWSMGEKLDVIPLGNGVFLNPLPWMGIDDYAKRVRTADLLLSLMLSPHPSYPPLEMAASGKLVVTNSFSVKTMKRMQALSPNILVADPTPDRIGNALKNALGRINAGLQSHDPTGTMDIPSNWDAGLGSIIPQLKERIDSLRRTPVQCNKPMTNGYPSTPISEYERFRKRRLSQRRKKGLYHQESGLLSFVTSAYNTDPKYLEELATSVFLQDGGTNFEWFILDNGSTHEDTCDALLMIAKHPCVRLEKVKNNLGIIGGMRYCLEHAKGRYILPLDSDDIIEPDAIHVITDFIQKSGFPSLLYTDEDKLTDGQFGSPYFKPGWDPVLFINSCYIAHLCAIDRKKALDIGLYLDITAEGCHDWDSFIRFMEAGDVPLHIPEVLYTWRMHSNSTSGNIRSKSYITDSHKATLRRFLKHAEAPDIELVQSPLFNDNVDWWFRRKRCNPISHLSIFISHGKRRPDDFIGKNIFFLNPEDGLKCLSEILEQKKCDLVHFCWDGIVPDNDEWIYEATGLIELFPDTVIVGGFLHNDKKVLDGPRIFGFGNGFDSPDRGRSLSDPGYFANMWKPHSVSALSSGHFLVGFDFLKEVLPELIREEVPLNMLGPWLGALARENLKRVIYSPFIRASAKFVPEDGASSEDQSCFLSRFWHLIPEEDLLSSRLGLDTNHAYIPVDNSKRDQHLKVLQQKTLSYSDWFDRKIRHRATRYPLPDKIPTLSIITAVYEGSNHSLLDLLADSITKQTHPPHQWVIVASGPILKDTLQYIQEKAKNLWNATLIFNPESLGIIGALRRGLECADGQYIAVADADDLLTYDAVQILSHEINRLNEPDMIYSDEDLLVDGKPMAPYLRSSFDAVLNLDTSYIWHLCAIKRSTALNLDLYTDAKSNWCQDWDSVMRVANAGGKIEYISEVLYHWRHHSASTTNKPDGDPRSLDSVRHILEKQILRTSHPEQFSVEVFPVNRGTKELYIARRNLDLPKFVWIGDVLSGCWPSDSIEDGVLVVTSGDVIIDKERTFNEVARLFDLHPGVAAIGGRVFDKSNLVVDGCLVTNEQGKFESPWVGNLEDNVGPYALALKPQIVACTGVSLAFFRIKALESMRIHLPEDASGRFLWVFKTCEQLSCGGWKIAFSPLVSARTTKSSLMTHQWDYIFNESSSTEVHALARYGRCCQFNFR